MRTCLVLLALLLAAVSPSAFAHEVRPAYLELTQTSADTFDVLWKVPARADSMRLGIYVRLPDAAEAVSEPRAMFTGGAFVERWSVRHPDALVGGVISVDGLRTTMTDVLVRIARSDGSTQVARITPSNTTLIVEASPSAWRLSWTYFVIGVEHILLGIDHLLFVLALVILVKGWRRLVETITAFTIAHSITLALATLGVVRVPGPPVEAIIALSIVFVASEIIRARQGRQGLTERWPWTVAFTFGLLHGLGFAGALSEVGLPQQAIPLALLFFNVGVEAGQLLFVAGALAAGRILKQLWKRPPEWSWQVLPYAIGCVAMSWVIERVAGF